jgi:hypothetical protein
MINCDKVLADLWDWLADKEAHPDYKPIKEHLEQCAGCAQESEQILMLRSTLKEISHQPSAGFEERLKQKLHQAEQDIPAGHDIENAEKPAARIFKVNWKRAVGLMAAGAAAVLIIGIGRNDPGVTGSNPEFADSSPVQKVEKTSGVIAERDWMPEDSLNNSATDKADVNERDTMHRVSTGH